MIELGAGASLVRLVGGLFWFLLIATFVAAWLIPKTVQGRLLAFACIIAVFLAFPGRWAWNDYQARRAYVARLTKATEIFNARCKTAGEKIYRTAENVEGVFLLKVRPERPYPYGEQFAMDDPYGRDLEGEGYIETFLRGSYQAGVKGPAPPGAPSRLGFLYVEAIDETDGRRYRYTGSVKAVRRKDTTAENVRRELERNPAYDLNIYAYVVDRVPAPSAPPRYGVTYDDISTRAEREYWIAGSSLRIIDLQTKEVIAERIGYMMDQGQGSGAGSRRPWLFAADNACPSFGQRHGSRQQIGQAQAFTEKVLKPKLEK